MDKEQLLSKVMELEKENKKLVQKIQFLEALNNEMQNSHSWRYTAPLRYLGRIARKIVCSTFKSNENNNVTVERNPLLADFYTISDLQRRVEESEEFSANIKFSIVVPLYNTPLNFLEEMIQSVQNQTYKNWELCLADGSDAKHCQVGEKVLEFATKDERIKYKKLEKNLGISENTNACIAMATGEYIGLFDHDDLLHPSALYEVMKKICNYGADFIYTDEATFLSETREITLRHYKPDFAIDTLRSNNYICHFSAFSRSLLEKVGCFQKEYDSSQDHDLILRLTEKAGCICHIPKILYFWRAHQNSIALTSDAKSYTAAAGRKVVLASIQRNGMEAEVESSEIHPNIYRVKYKIKSFDKVSIIIPTKNHSADLKKCINSILNLTTYKNYEIIIIDNGSDEQELFDYYKTLENYDNIHVYSYDIEFNYSKLNNYAATIATGKYYILLNNDTEVITPEWIEEMLMFVQREDVAAAGAKLYYPDNTIQHGGVILGILGVAGHAFRYFPKWNNGYMGHLQYVQDLSAVTAACLMVKASVFDEINGLDESFAVAFNDVDFCMRIRKAGYLIVWTPYAELYHYESKSRGLEDTPEKKKRFQGEVLRFQKRWQKELEMGDPYYNPNLTLDREDFSLR